MLYLSQRKILQINRMMDQGGGTPPAQAQAQAQAANPPLAQPPAYVPTVQQLGATQTHAVQDNVNGSPSGQSGNLYTAKLSSEGINKIEADIDNENKNIERNRKLLKYWRLLVGFFAFCSVAIGIGANMKYGPGNMSAFESLSGKEGLNGSINDPLRGLNYGFAIFGFAIPIIGTLVSIICAIVKNNEINKSLHNNKLRNICKSEIQINKEWEIVKNNDDIKKIVEEAPKNDISIPTALTIAEVVYQQQKRNNAAIKKVSSNSGR